MKPFWQNRLEWDHLFCLNPQDLLPRLALGPPVIFDVRTQSSVKVSQLASQWSKITKNASGFFGKPFVFEDWLNDIHSSAVAPANRFGSVMSVHEVMGLIRNIPSERSVPPFPTCDPPLPSETLQSHLVCEGFEDLASWTSSGWRFQAGRTLGVMRDKWEREVAPSFRRDAVDIITRGWDGGHVIDLAPAWFKSPPLSS